jgi:hypothetical protein
MRDFLDLGLAPILLRPSWLEVAMGVLLAATVATFACAVFGRGGRVAARLPGWLGLAALLAAVADRASGAAEIASRFLRLDGGGYDEVLDLAALLLRWSAAIAIGAGIAATGLVLGWIAEAVEERRRVS